MMNFMITMNVNDIISWSIIGILLIIIIVIYGTEMIKDFIKKLKGGK